MKNITKLLTNLFIIIVFSIICSYFLTKYFSNTIFQALYSYAETESQKIANEIITESLTEQLQTDLQEDSLYEIIKNSKEEIQLINFDATKINQILSKLTNNIEEKIKDMEASQQDNDYLISTQSGLIYNLPIGAVSGNVFLSNLGTKIPLKLTLTGDVKSNIETSLTEYGLNNALLKIEIKIIINTKIIAPFTSEELTIENTLPVSIKVIQGIIPDYYLNNSAT